MSSTNSKNDALALVTVKLSEIFQSLCPNYDVDGYQLQVVGELAEHFHELGRAEKGHFMLSYPEKIRVSILDNIMFQIRKDLIEAKQQAAYSQHDNEAANDFEKGVLAVIALIEFRIHCLCDF